MASTQASTPALAFAQWRAAHDQWQSLLDRQEAALNGGGPMPPADEVRKAQRAAEVALVALEGRA